MTGQPIRVVLVDDHPAILDAVGSAVQAAPDLQLAGTARSLDDALALLEAAGTVDVVVTDVQLAGEAEGLRLLDAIGGEGPGVLLLSSFDQPPLVRTAFERGAAGYLLKTSELPRDPRRDPHRRRGRHRCSRPRCCGRSAPRRAGPRTARSRC